VKSTASSGSAPSADATIATRRDFLKATVTAATATALAGVTLPHVFAAEDNTLKIALIGAGGRGSGAAANALRVENAPTRLVAMADVFESKLKGSYEGLKNSEVGEKVQVSDDHKFLGFDAGMKQKSTDATIQNEANNGLKNDHYTLAMARTNAPHSASSQFFINTKDNGFLNHTAETSSGWGYAVFGKVIEGKDIVDAIEKVKTGNSGGHGDVPVDAVVIERAVEVDA